MKTTDYRQIEKLYLKEVVTAPAPVKTPVKPGHAPSKPKTDPNPFAPRPGRTPKENPAPKPKGALENISDSLRGIFQKYIKQASS